MKAVHTLIWALVAGCIVALPVVALAGYLRVAAGLASVGLGEVAVLIAFRWHCPLTGLAGRYTDDRRDNFDNYLPLWLARYNQRIFGTWFLIGGIVAGWAWWHSQ